MSAKNFHRFVKPPSGGSKETVTPHLYVSGVGDSLKTPIELIHAIFEPYGELDNEQPWGAIDYPEGRRYVFVSYKNMEDSEKAYADLGNGKSLEALGGGKLYIRYAERAVEKDSKRPTEAECTSATRDVQVPGLILVEQFLSENEEAHLLNLLDSSPWEEGLSRRVQHYGVPFNYRTLMLDYNRKVNPIPVEMSKVTQKMIDFASHKRLETSSPYAGETETGIEGTIAARGTEMPLLSLGQLTVNEYEPGQGIAAHIDTYNCFGPEIFVLSLGSGVTMNMVKRREDAGENAGAEEGGGEEDEEDVTVRGDGRKRKAVWLPPRSLLVLSGEARYSWSHSIPSRLTDKVNGQLHERSRRVSLTFREALLPNSKAEHVGASKVEIDHVFRVYDNIAVHWNHTRGKRKVHWSRVKAFLEALPPGSLLADIGSGDGKYFGLNPGVVCVGCDRSWNLLQVSSEPSHETLCCDIVRLPYRDSLFDATICVAVLHHLASKDRRVAAVRELVRITRAGGRVLIQAWAKEQEENSRLAFTEQDVLVPWRLQPRFYEDKDKGKGAESGDRGRDREEEGQGESEQSRAGPCMETETQPTTTSTTGTGATSRLPSSLQSPEGPCEHVQEDERGALVFQRYCHVYRKGELEDLCSGVPGALVEQAGWDKGNWFVVLRKEECLSAVMGLPVNPVQYAHPSFESRRDVDTGKQSSTSTSTSQGNNTNHLNRSLRSVSVNNRAKKDVGVKRES